MTPLKVLAELWVDQGVVKLQRSVRVVRGWCDGVSNFPPGVSVYKQQREKTEKKIHHYRTINMNRQSTTIHLIGF